MPLSIPPFRKRHIRVFLEVLADAILELYRIDRRFGMLGGDGEVDPHRTRLDDISQTGQRLLEGVQVVLRGVDVKRDTSPL